MINRINDSSFWRAYEDRELTHSAAHYLTTIEYLRNRYGYARVTDVAEHLKISRGAASRALALLRERGWIQEDPHRMLELTPEGLELARAVERNYLVVECFLEEILGVPGAVAREDACKMEHLLNPQTIAALLRLIRVLEQQPPLLDRLREGLHAGPLDGDQEALCSIGEQLNRLLASIQPPDSHLEEKKEVPDACPAPKK